MGASAAPSVHRVVPEQLHAVRGWLHSALRRAPRRDDGVAGACRAMAAALRAGMSIEHAFRAAARSGSTPLHAAFRSMADELALGMSFAEVVERWRARRPDDQVVNLLADTLVLCRRSGGDLAGVCHRLAILVHERQRLVAEGESLTASARFSARAVILLPVLGFGGWLALAPEAVLDVLRGGSLLLIVPALIMIVVGAVVIQRIAGRVHTELSATSTHTQSADTSIVTRCMLRLCGTRFEAAAMCRGAAGCGAIAMLPSIIAGSKPGALGVWAIIVAIGAGGAWPWLRHRQRAAEHAHGIERGLAGLLEVTIAYLSAGATPHEAILGSIQRAPAHLGSMLKPVARQIELGRAPASALAAAPFIVEHAVLDAWATALTSSASNGAPAHATMEVLLADVRSDERERYRRTAAALGPRMQLIVVVMLVPPITWIVLVATFSSMTGMLPL